MGVLEDLFLTQREFPLPCLDTPEFIGFIDSAAYELSKNYSSTSIVSFNEDEIPDIFDQLHVYSSKLVIHLYYFLCKLFANFLLIIKF